MDGNEVIAQLELAKIIQKTSYDKVSAYDGVFLDKQVWLCGTHLVTDPLNDWRVAGACLERSLSEADPRSLGRQKAWASLDPNRNMSFMVQHVSIPAAICKKFAEDDKHHRQRIEWLTLKR